MGLIITTLLDVLDTTTSHHTSSQYITVHLLLFTKSKNIKSILSVLKLFIVIDGSNSCLTLRDISIVIDVIRDKAQGFEPSFTDSVTIWLEKLVEDVVRSLNRLLFSNTRLLQQIGDNVTTGQLSRLREVNTDELSKTR